MPIILATQGAEIRRIAVQGQLWQIVHKTLSWKKPITKECLPSKGETFTSKPSKQTKKQVVIGRDTYTVTSLCVSVNIQQPFYLSFPVVNWHILVVQGGINCDIYIGAYNIS
jgi:hypothetical protein